MKKPFLTFTFFLVVFTATAQTEKQKAYFTKILTSNKVEITKQDLTKTLCSPSHWMLLAGYTADKEFTAPSSNQSLWFGKDRKLLYATIFTARASDIPIGKWTFIKAENKLLLDFGKSGDTFKVYVLNPIEMMIEDSDKNRYYYIAKTDIDEAPQALQWKLQFQMP